MTTVNGPKILLTFTGFHDPYALGLIGREEQEGPILTLVRAISFDQVILFSTPNTGKHTERTRQILLELYPGLGIEVRNLALADPTDYISILEGLRHHFSEIDKDTLDKRPKYYITVASGTPQMHACWFLLASSGEIPATILHVRPHRFVSKDLPLVSEVKLSDSAFPVIRAVPKLQKVNGDILEDLESAIRGLGIIGEDPGFLKALEVSAALAASTAAILILGETGTGKELFARLIHHLSGRPVDRFLPINCAAIPKELIESFLFGHRKGSFTGAISDQSGKFELANGGTLLLDEVGELPLDLQGKLLRALQDGIIEPLGSRKPSKVDVRIIAATNKDIPNAVGNGTFRQDLYYRLQVGEIQLPPLRERRSDIPKLALHLLDRISASLRGPKRLSTDALNRLQNHSWPGNVRELENVLERSVRLVRKDVIEADDLIISEPVGRQDPLSKLPTPAADFSLEKFLSSARKQLILRALEIARGNKSEAARLLGVSPQAVHKYLKKNDPGLNRG